MTTTTTTTTDTGAIRMTVRKDDQIIGWAEKYADGTRNWTVCYLPAEAHLAEIIGTLPKRDALGWLISKAATR